MKKLWLLLLIPLILPVLYFTTLIGSQEPQKPVRTPDIASQPTVQPPSADEIYRLVNEERVKVGVKPLTLDPRLVKSAQEKADDMTNGKYFEHVSPSGVRGISLIAKYANECKVGSENLAQAQKSSEQTVGAWLNSTTHREAMLSGLYSLTGVAISGNMTVQHFCQL